MNDLSHIVSIHYTKSNVIRAVRYFCWRVTGWKYLAALALVAVSLAFALSKNDWSFLNGVLATVLAAGILFPFLLYGVHYRNTVGRFERLGSKEAVITFDERALKLTADTGASELTWSADYELWRHRDVWLLLINRAQFITLPTADLSPEVKTALARLVTHHGGRVRG